MPKLRPPRGRQAAAVLEPQDEIDLQATDGADQGRGEGAHLAAEIPTEEITEGAGDASSLRAQIAALERSNQEYLARIETERQEKADALRRAQEREAEIGRLQEQTTSSQADAINAALAAAQAEAESAERDIEAAASLGDAKAQAEAYRKLSRAEARIISLESGKEALEREIKSRPEVKPAVQQDDPLDKINLPPLAKDWLRKHPEFMHDPRKNAKIQTLHYDVVDEGYAPYSKDYFEVLEQKLGMRKATKQTEPEYEEDDDVEDNQSTRRTIVSAPPSRETPSSSGVRGPDRVTLSSAEKEAARISGISEKDYAANKLKLLKEKAQGNYGGQP
jgi:multidrug efflux pump subunit AcrA (membrane-fusion protein)